MPSIRVVHEVWDLRGAETPVEDKKSVPYWILPGNLIRTTMVDKGCPYENGITLSAKKPGFEPRGAKEITPLPRGPISGIIIRFWVVLLPIFGLMDGWGRP